MPDTDLLNHIVDATKSDGFTYLNVNASNVQELITHGLVETNAADVNTSGQTAVRATSLGLSQIEPKEKGTSMTLVVENIPVTKPERKVTREPSEASQTLRQLEIGQSVVIDGIDQKKAQSLINSTERHFSVAKEPKARKDGTMFTPRDYPRKFAAVVEGSGMRIGRTA